jgi:hypothetical protein
VPHDPKHRIDLYQNVREDDLRRQMLHQDIVIEAEVGLSDRGVKRNRSVSRCSVINRSKYPNLGIADV